MMLGRADRGDPAYTIINQGIGGEKISNYSGKERE